MSGPTLVVLLDQTLEEERSFTFSRGRHTTDMAVATRNSFVGYTQIPFDLYHARERGESRLDLLAQAFDATTVTRNMYRVIQAKVVFPFAALFAR